MVLVRWHLGCRPLVADRHGLGIGAEIMGQGKFGVQTGPWTDVGADDAGGWWGDNPPYHVPVFVLTHHPRACVSMNGGTVFHFVVDGIEAALERARSAAGGRDVRIGGGAATVREYLRAGLIDTLHGAGADPARPWRSPVGRRRERR